MIAEYLPTLLIIDLFQYLEKFVFLFMGMPYEFPLHFCDQHLHSIHPCHSMRMPISFYGY